MMPIGPLMIEHRLIERVIRVLGDALPKMDQQLNPLSVDAVVDFVRVYADRTHHGKEEDILFRDLSAKELSFEDRDVMQQLVREHIQARRVVAALVAAKERYEGGDGGALADVRTQIQALVDLYPAHIAKEDKVFFPAAMRYLNRAEQDDMIAEMYEFDRKMIHEKYKSVVERLELTQSW